MTSARKSLHIVETYFIVSLSLGKNFISFVFNGTEMLKNLNA